jgi:hypothetical protein
MVDERDRYALDAIEQHLSAAARAAEGGRVRRDDESASEANREPRERRLGR